ncbi:MAG: amidohydrolase [Christensenellaceae bacterium]|jgi:aminobenzoyl-glutamate utilization protein B|nr:amidohydrolase [Christensenellaceae bacterium]
MTDLEFISKAVDQRQKEILGASDAIWGFAELPYAEFQSAALLVKLLKDEGFAVDEGVAGMPTSFVGRFQVGSGGYKMGFLGEFDALDILSQEAANPIKTPIKDGAPGHGCGHNALGAGALAAAFALRDYLVQNSISGTVFYFGCAAEEGAGSKQFMARAGLFDEMDFIYTWHPATQNGVDAQASVAIMGANFEFFGLTSHAGGSPHLGRSALDAAELMSVGVNYLREHTINEARIHYAYVDAGGVAPNVVQDHSLVKYEVRSPKVYQVKDLFERVVNVARGAALMTGTTMKYEITMAFSDYIANDALAKVADEALRAVGAPKWSESDYSLARSFLNTYNAETKESIREAAVKLYGEEKADEALEQPLDSVIHPYDPEHAGIASGSTDVGDVCYAAPTLNLRVATACIGNVGHTWQMTAQAGSEIAHKGLLVAAKAMALAAVYTMQRPEVIQRAKALVKKQNGGRYVCPLPDEIAPPIGKY